MLRALPPEADAMVQRQHGVATVTQLLGAGMTKRQLSAATQRGLLLNPRRGIYVDRAAWRSASNSARHGMRLLAVQLVAPDAVGIGLSSALIWQLPVRRPPEEPLVWRSTEQGPLAGARVLRTLPAPHGITIIEDVLVAGLAETAVIVAATSPLPDALITMDAALRRGVPLQELLDAVDHLPTATRRGRAHAAVSSADPWSESWLESLSRGRVIELGMPIPLSNVTIMCEGKEARVDKLWADLGVVGEADGKGKYEKQGPSIAEAHWREKQRREWLEEIGFEVASWGTRQVAGDGLAMKRRVDRAMSRQAQLPFVWPPAVQAELRRLPGVTPPEHVADEVERLRSVGIPIRLAEPDWWRVPERPPSLWTPTRSLSEN